MRISVIIAVIILVALFPVQSTGHSFSPEIHTESYYNFTGLNPGAFPQSNPQFSFRTSGSTVSFNASIEQGVAMKGLNIAAQHYSSWSAFSTVINSTGANSNITFLFSWNNRLSSSLTGNFVTFMNGSTVLLNLSFGPEQGYSTRILAGNNSEKIGPEPGMNSLYRIELLTPANSSLEYLEILNTSFAGTQLPVSVPFHRTGALDNLSVSFGGEYCNFTLYNISYNTVFPSSAIYASGNIVTNQKAIIPSAQVSVLNNGSGQPLLARNINSVLYVGQNGSVFRLNYYNGSVSTVYVNGYAGSVLWTSDCYAGNNAYFILSRVGSFTLVSIDMQDMVVKFNTVNLSLPEKFVLQQIRGSLLIAGYYGGLILINTSNPGNTTSFTVPGFTGNSSGPALVQSGIRNSLADITYYYPNNSTLVGYDINADSLSISSTGSSPLSPFDQGLSLISYSSNSSAVSSLLYMAGTGTDMIFTDSMKIVVPFTGNGTGMQATATDHVLLSSGQFFYELSGNGTAQKSGLAVQAGETVWYRGSYGVRYSNGEITVFSFGNVSAYSASQVSVTGNSTSYIYRNTTVYFSVNSSLMFTLHASFGNYSEVRYNSSSLQIDATALANGQYNLYVWVINLAGYESSFNSSLYVDHGIPALNTTLNQSGYVSNSTIVDYGVNWSVGIQNMYVSYLGSTYAIPSGSGSFPLQTGEYSGQITVSLLLIDKFGRSFTFNFSETVIWNNPRNFSINVWNGEYLNSTILDLAWSNVSYASHYSVALEYGNFWNNLTESSNHTVLSLHNGNYYLEIMAALDNGSSELVGSADFTVMDYAPSVSVSHSTDSSYSFFGNSENSSLFFNVTGNVTSSIRAEVYSPSGTQIMRENATDLLNITVSRLQAGFELNGEYSIDVSVTGLSNLHNYTQFTFIVNNTVPENPVQNGSSLYTGRNLVYLGNGGFRHSSLRMESFGELLPYALNSNGTVMLQNGTGTYRFTLTVVSDSGNYNSSAFAVYYYTAPPEINYTISSGVLLKSSVLSVRADITDIVPVRTLTFSFGNKTVHEQSPAHSGTYNLSFSADGNFTVRIAVEDYCYNDNNTSFTILVEHYPLVKSLSISPLDFYAFQYLKGSISGYRISMMNETWYVNGKESGTGISFLDSLPLGFDNITFVVSYGNVSVSTSTTVFSAGPFIPGILAAALILFLTYRRFSGSGDEGKILEFLGKCNGLKVKTVLKMASKSGLKKSSVERKMNDMVEGNSAAYALDPDGDKYFRTVK